METTTEDPYRVDDRTVERSRLVVERNLASEHRSFRVADELSLPPLRAGADLLTPVRFEAEVVLEDGRVVRTHRVVRSTLGRDGAGRTSFSVESGASAGTASNEVLRRALVALSRGPLSDLVATPRAVLEALRAPCPEVLAVTTRDLASGHVAATHGRLVEVSVFLEGLAEDLRDGAPLSWSLRHRFPAEPR